MRYQINSNIPRTKKMKIQLFLRWFFYALCLLFFYCLMYCGAFNRWQPYFIVSFTLAVSLNEQEVPSSVFGVICGLLLDIATGTLFCFHAIWLMPCCLITSLLSRNLIKENFLNHLIVTAISCILILSMHYLFNYVIWNEPNSSLVLFNVMLPSFGSTLIVSPLVFFIARRIDRRFTVKKKKELQDTVQDIAEDEKKFM